MTRHSTCAARLGATALLLAVPCTAMAQSAPGAGSFPGSVLIPGTDTSLRIGGYAKLDVQIDHGVHEDFLANGAGSGTLVSIIPLDDNVPGSIPGAGHNIHGTTRLTAAESRINFETRTPSPYGELITYIEGDFEGVSGLTPGNTFMTNSDRSAFALRLAYGALGPFLAGQVNPLFLDQRAQPETLDFGGVLFAAGPLRQPELRYTWLFPNGFSVAAAIDNPQTQIVSQAGATNSTFQLSQGDKIPDFIGAITYAPPLGHLSLRAVARELYDHGPGAAGAGTQGAPPSGGNTNGGSASASTFGWGAGLSGDVYVFDRDRIIFQSNGGYGIGRYISNTGTNVGDSVISADGKTLKTVNSYNAGVGFQHYWSDTLRSTVAVSYEYFNYPKSLFPATAATFAPPGAFGQLNRRFEDGHINLIWSPLPPVDFGVEFIYEQRKTEGNQRGNLERTQISTKFRF